MITEENNKQNGIVANAPQAGTPVAPAGDVTPEAIFDPILNGEGEESPVVDGENLDLTKAHQAYYDAAIDIATRPLNTPTATRATTYEDLFRKMRPDPTPTLDDMMMEASRDRRARNIAAIGDFATAIANMGGTMAGAPSQTLPQGGAKKVYDDKVELLRKIRKEQAEQWEKGLERAMVRDDKVYNAELTENQRVRQLEQADRKNVSNLYLRISDNIRKAQEAQVRGDLAAAKIYTEQARAEVERTKAAKTGALMDSQIKRNVDQGTAALIRASKAGSGGSGGGRGGNKTTWTVEGKEYNNTYKAWAALPEEYRGTGKSSTSMQRDLAEYEVAQSSNKGKGGKKIGW